MTTNNSFNKGNGTLAQRCDPVCDALPVYIKGQVTPRQTYRARDCFLRQVHRLENVARFVALRRAGGPVRDRGYILECHHKRLGIDALYREIQDMWQCLPKVRVQADAERFKGRKRLFANTGAARPPFLSVFYGEFCREAEPHDQGHGQCARSQTPFLATAIGEWRERRARLNLRRRATSAPIPTGP